MSPHPERWRRRTGETGMDVGNAVLSRWPVVRHDSLVLPGGDGQTVLYAAVAAPDGEVPFFTTHLTSAPSGSALRCDQVRAVARFVADHDRTGHPPVLVGDLNAEPDSDEIRLLGGHLTAPAVPGLVLLDAWRFAEGPGWTFARRNPYLADSGLPDGRIDYVHVGLRGLARTGRPRAARVAGDEPVDGVWPSDHFAVVAELMA
jgi:endonuclease/exonuclease/phosphatase family metal-dependent hydrolase